VRAVAGTGQVQVQGQGKTGSHISHQSLLKGGVATVNSMLLANSRQLQQKESDMPTCVPVHCEVTTRLIHQHLVQVSLD
jgi:hypothetical protein